MVRRSSTSQLWPVSLNLRLTYQHAEDGSTSPAIGRTERTLPRFFGYAKIRRILQGLRSAKVSLLEVAAKTGERDIERAAPCFRRLQAERPPASGREVADSSDYEEAAKAGNRCRAKES
jgi:hypothetical protein